MGTWEGSNKIQVIENENKTKKKEKMGPTRQTVQCRRRRAEGQITPRTFDKTSRNLITLYLPKILHSAYKCVQTWIYANWDENDPQKKHRLTKIPVPSMKHFLSISFSVYFKWFLNNTHYCCCPWVHFRSLR